MKINITIELDTDTQEISWECGEGIECLEILDILRGVEDSVLEDYAEEIEQSIIASIQMLAEQQTHIKKDSNIKISIKELLKFEGIYKKKKGKKNDKKD